MNETNTIQAGERTQHTDIRPATHGFNVYIGKAMVQVHVNDEDEEEGLRLARLIASACDMREACEAAYDLIEGLVDGAPDASPRSKQANFVAAQLQNALAKAGGEA